MLIPITVAAHALFATLDGLRRVILDRTGEWLDRRIRGPVLAMDLRRALAATAHEPAQGMRDLGALRSFVTGPAVGPIMDLPWVPIYIAALFVVDPLLGWIGIAAALVLGAIAVVNEALTRRAHAVTRAAGGRAQQRIASVLRNAEVVTALDMFAGADRLVAESEGEAREAARRASVRGTLMSSLSKFFRISVQTCIMAAGAWLAINDRGTAGAIFAASFLLSRALMPVENAIATWQSVVAATSAYRRLARSFRDAAPEGPRLAMPCPSGGLTIDGVSYLLPDATQPILSDIRLSVAPGEALGIVGPSGAGKSTLARVMSGAWSPTEGSARIDGADVRLWLGTGGARYLGYLPQDIELFDATVADNIARLAEAPDAEEVIAAAKLSGIHDFVLRLPRGYDTGIGEGGVRLSGGQRQRIGLARALYGRPRLLVLDEPNSSLDQEGEAALLHAVEAMKRAGAVIVMITHKANILQAADKLCLIRNGRVDAFGARDAVIAEINQRSLAGRRAGAPLAQSA
jgi:PrtD family type I secretion system ABC transporter